MNKPLFAALALAATLAGCAGTSTVMTGQARPPIDPSQVRIYRTLPPDSVEIAQLESTSGIGFGTQGRPMRSSPDSSAKPRPWAPMA